MNMVGLLMILSILPLLVIFMVENYRAVLLKEWESNIHDFLQTLISKAITSLCLT